MKHFHVDKGTLYENVHLTEHSAESQIDEFVVNEMFDESDVREYLADFIIFKFSDTHFAIIARKFIREIE